MRRGCCETVAAAVLCAIGLTATIGVATNRDYQRPDWRGVAALVGPAGRGERAILVQHYRDLLPLSLYVPGIRRMAPRGVRVRELDVISFTSPPSGGRPRWRSSHSTSGSAPRQPRKASA